MTIRTVFLAPLTGLLLAACAACSPKGAVSPVAPAPELPPTPLATFDNEWATLGIFEDGRLTATPRPIKAPRGEMVLLVLVPEKTAWLGPLIAGKTVSGQAEFDKLVAGHRLRPGRVLAFDDGTNGILLHFPQIPDDPHPVAKAFSMVEQVRSVQLRQAY
jgi:hypothetical protein